MNANNIPPTENLNKSGEEFSMPKKKLGKNKSTIPVVDANEVIFFKIGKQVIFKPLIVRNEDEFRKFTNGDLEHSFNPYYTHQIFQDEKITGYKGLKILISLTARSLHPHIKIKYESVSTLRDDLELLLKKHYEHTYESDDDKFIKKLNEDIGTPVGEVIKAEGDLEVCII
jgi:hypothetical protein